MSEREYQVTVALAVTAEDSTQAAVFAIDDLRDRDLPITQLFVAGNNENVQVKFSGDQSRCQLCRKVWPDEGLRAIAHLGERVAPGEPMPSGECPDRFCGGLCQPVTS